MTAPNDASKATIAEATVKNCGFTLDPPSTGHHRLTPAQLGLYDDLATDLLVENVFYDTKIQKFTALYISSLASKKEIVSILQEVGGKVHAASTAVLGLVTLPKFKELYESLTDREKEDFRCHLQKYVEIYLPGCPFEISSTSRYTSVPEAAVIARQNIKRGAIDYLTGTLAHLTKEEAKNLDQRHRNFSILESARHGGASLMLGAARFVNHRCRESNARLEVVGDSGVQITAIRKIWMGEEITIEYSAGFFGEDNCDCHCPTCGERSDCEITPQRQLRPRACPSTDTHCHPNLRRHREIYGFDWPRVVEEGLVSCGLA